MFTLKQVNEDGSENIYMGIPVSYFGSDNPRGPLITYTNENGDECEIRWGKVYVMGIHGSTVASYDMGNSQNPKSVYSSGSSVSRREWNI